MPSNTSFPIDYTNTLPATYTSQWWTPEGTPGLNSTDIWNTDWDPSFTPGWNTDFGVDFGDTGTTGGNTDFWNQGLGGKLFDFGIAGLNTGMGISAMNEAQQAAQVQAERAAQATRKGNIWSAGCLLLSCYWVLGACYRVVTEFWALVPEVLLSSGRLLLSCY